MSENLVEELISMGFDRNIARIAVENNKNNSIDDAINWILNQNDLSIDNFIDNSDNNNVIIQEDLKLVLVVRSDLQMTSGKMAAQCVHAALSVVRLIENRNPLVLETWRRKGEPTICLRCSSEDELNSLESCASSIGKFYFYFIVFLFLCYCVIRLIDWLIDSLNSL